MLTRGAASCSRPCGLDNRTRTQPHHIQIPSHHPRTVQPPSHRPTAVLPEPHNGLSHSPPFRAMPRQNFLHMPTAHRETRAYTKISKKKGYSTPTHRARQVGTTDGNTYLAERGPRVTNQPTALDPAAQVPTVLLPARTWLALMGHNACHETHASHEQCTHAAHSAPSFASCIEFMSQSFGCR
jgi:hypothetical protein